MYKIIENTHDYRIALRAIDQIDFSQSGAGMEFIYMPYGKRRNGIINAMGNADGKCGNEIMLITRKIVSGLTDEEMCMVMANKIRNNVWAFTWGELYIALDERYAKEGKSADVIARKAVGIDSVHVADGVTNENEKLKLHDKYKQRLMGMLNEIADEKLVMRVLPKIDDAKERDILFSKLSETNIVAIATDYGEKLDVCVEAARYVKNQEDLLKAMGVILHMLANEERLKRCDENKIKATAAKFPKLSGEILATLMSNEKCDWKYLLDQVSSAMAYQLITEGKIGCLSAEEAIAEKIDKESIDVKVYSKARSLATKKSLMARMSDVQKKAVRELDEKVYALVLGKAKIAAKDTFELDGFYLGMTYDDMKVVFAHHFPNFEIVEDKDNDGDSMFRVSYQTRPFCYADAKTGKVYQFNFGKKILQKWYKYDTQTYMEWAGLYEKETKSKMVYKMLQKDTDVYDKWAQRSYRVWLHQETYAHKSNAKGYVLTYFGEPKIESLHSGIAGYVLQNEAQRAFRYASADAGTLRVAYSAD